MTILDAGVSCGALRKAQYTMIQSIKIVKPNNLTSWRDLNFQSWKFPGGEIGFKLTNLFKPEFSDAQIKFVSNRHILISSRLTTSDSILELMMAVNAIKKIEKDIPIRLYAPYIPYGRQDRVCSEGESFSLKVFAQLINGLGFEKIYTISPHSKTTEDLIDNLEVVSIDGHIRGRFLAHMDAENTVLVAPDLGAIKRTEQLAKVFLEDRKPNMIVQKLPIIFSNKKREMATGKIIGLEVYGDVKGKKCFIVDDLIDGGR